MKITKRYSISLIVIYILAMAFSMSLQAQSELNRFFEYIFFLA